MTRFVGASVLFATLVTTAACGVGNDPGTPPGGGSDDRNTKLGIVCSASFKVTGTFVPGTPTAPLDPDTGMPYTGCWPVGTWTFTAAVDTNECKTPPTVLPSYAFRVDRMDPDGTGLVESYTNMTNVGALKSHIKISANGQGCQAHMEFGSADGKEYWDMQPALLKGGATTLVGSGDYDLYTTSNGWPWE